MECSGQQSGWAKLRHGELLSAVIGITEGTYPQPLGENWKGEGGWNNKILRS